MIKENFKLKKKCLKSKIGK